jgi:hypothetical protein
MLKQRPLPRSGGELYQAGETTAATECQCAQTLSAADAARGPLQRRGRGGPGQVGEFTVVHWHDTDSDSGYTGGLWHDARSLNQGGEGRGGRAF